MSSRATVNWSAVLLCGALGCASTTPAPTSPVHEHWLPGYLFGIWGKAELDVRDDCPTSGASDIRVGSTWATLLVGLGTLGMYTPREARVQCREQP